jgi:PAS domain S-box-containing protein
MITIDSSGAIVFWNNTAETMFGCASTEVIGQPLAFIMPERLRAAHQNGMERLLSTGKPRILGTTAEMIGLRRDGTEFPVELSLSMWKIKENTFFTGIIRDITARRRAEKEIESLARFPSENRNPVLRVSLDGTIRYANSASAPFLARWSKDGDTGLPDALRVLVADALDSGASRTGEVAVGERIFSFDVAPVQQAGYANLYGRDVTEQMRAEAALKEQNQFIVNVIEALNHPFYVINADDYTVELANSAAHQSKLGGPVTCHALTHRWSSPCLDYGQPCPMEEIKKTGEPTIVEHYHYDREGRQRSFEVHAHPVFDSSGNVIQIIEYTLDITERKQVAETLEQTTKLLETIFENTPVLMAYLDPDLNFIRVNQAYAAADERDPSFFPGKNHFELFPDAANERIFRDVVESGEPYFVYARPFEYAEHPERGVSYWDWSLIPLKDADGTVTGLVFTLSDVTERIQAELDLEKERDFTTAILDTAGALVIVLDPQGQIVSFNRACERLTGYTFDEVEGVPFWHLLLVSEEVEPVKEVFAELTSGQFPNEFENYWLTREGGRRLIAWSNTALVDETGAVDFIIGTGIDVTEQRDAEAALRRAHDQLELRVEKRTAELAETNRILQSEINQHRQTTATLQESEERYRRLVEVAFEAIIIHRDGKIIDINPAAAQLLGACTPAELIGMPIGDFVPSDHWDMVRSRLLEVKDGGTGVPLSAAKLMRLDGTIVEVEAAATASTYQGQPAVQMVIHDLTARKQAEREREKERERIARDLHDSLGHSLGYLRLKLDQFAYAEELGDAVDFGREVAQMRDVADQAYEIVRGMLATLHPSNADDLPTTLLALARAAGQRADFTVQLSSEGSVQPLHPIVQQQILYLFQEALNNIAQHAGADRVDLDLSWTEDALTVNITDDGCGFDINAVELTGHYGLRIMRERAEEINGHLTLDSSPGRGTRITLRVPLPRDASER